MRKVTAVCDTKRLDLVRSLGATEVVDYTREDFTRNGKTYDVVFDAVGKQSFRRCRNAVSPGGLYIETDLGFMWHVPLLALLTRLIGRKRVTMDSEVHEAGRRLRQGARGGREVPRGIDRRYPLEDVVEATTYVETGQKTGNVVLTLNGSQMITTDPRDMLALSEQRSAQYQAEAAAERLREPSATRRASRASCAALPIGSTRRHAPGGPRKRSPEADDEGCRPGAVRPTGRHRAPGDRDAVARGRRGARTSPRSVS